MPAPTNTSFGTAIDLGTITSTDTTATQQVDFAGTTYTVYYKFEVPAAGVAIGAFGFGDLVTYKPTTRLYDHTQTQVLTTASFNKPIQMPVVGGQFYFLEMTPNAGNPTPANLTLTVRLAPSTPIAAGSIAVNDDTAGYPLVFASGTVDNTVLQFIDNIVHGEHGDTLDSGIVLLEDGTTGDAFLYSASYATIADIPIASSAGAIRTHRPTQKFYLTDLGLTSKYYTVTSTGTISAGVSMTGAGTITAIAANAAETILYSVTQAAAAAIKRWDIVNGVALTDLAVGIASYQASDILVLADDTIVVLYYKSSTTSDTKALRYATNGTTLNTYNFGQYETSLSTPPRMASDMDAQTSFWIMQHQTSTHGVTNWKQVRVSDGTILTTRIGVLFATGIYSPAATATPIAHFGTSPSCPFWIVRSGLVTTAIYPIRRQRRFLLPSSDGNRRMRIPTLELLMRTGIGLLADATDSPTPLGVNPSVMMRISTDGGQTWGPERVRSGGERGHYLARVRWTQATGRYRNAVCEITVSDPVNWQFLAMLGDPEEGSS